MEVTYTKISKLEFIEFLEQNSYILHNIDTFVFDFYGPRTHYFKFNDEVVAYGVFKNSRLYEIQSFNASSEFLYSVFYNEHELKSKHKNSDVVCRNIDSNIINIFNNKLNKYTEFNVLQHPDEKYFVITKQKKIMSRREFMIYMGYMSDSDYYDL
jgi:hypothetical protein